MKYRYSVVIPIYNAASTLHRCVDSLLCQNKERAEIILVNDGSKDDSLQICRDYERRYLEIRVIDQANAGASAARNAGLDVAVGEFITFVDSDDFVPENYFDILDQSDDTDFVIYPYVRITADTSTPVDLPACLFQASNHYDRVIETVRNRFASPVNKRYKKEIIDKHGIRFQRDLIIGEDFLFGLTFMLHCETSSACNKVIYYVDESSTSSITRSSKFPTSQYTRIYEYAFQAVENSMWETSARLHLLQQLDYLFCRTAFVAALRLRNMETKDCSLQKLISDFRQLSHVEIRPLNPVHVIMKLCIQYKLIPVFRVVSALKSLHT